MSVDTEIAHVHSEDDAVRSNTAKERGRKTSSVCAEIPSLDGSSVPGPSHSRSDESIFFAHSPLGIPLLRSAGETPKLNSIARCLPCAPSHSTNRALNCSNSLNDGPPPRPQRDFARKRDNPRSKADDVG